MSVVTSHRWAARNIRPTAYERGMLRLATVLETHVARRVERRVEDARRAALEDCAGVGAHREHLVRTRSINLRLY